MGIASARDIQREDPTIIGLYGGYGYLNLSYLRLAGVRAPGGTPEAIDFSLFGEGDPPPYSPQKGDRNLACSLKMLRTVLKALNQKDLPPQVADSRQRAAAWIARRPSLDASNEMLLAYLLDFRPQIRANFRNHMITTFTASIVSGILVDGATAAGDVRLATDLLGAYGEVASAQYSAGMWEVAKVVRATPEVAAEFDKGVPGLLDRLRGRPEASDFLGAFGQFIADHGHRGPNDWEISARIWANTPELALVAIDRMRLAERDLAPAGRLHDVESKRGAAIAKVTPHLKGLDRANFKKAAKAMGYWARGREGTRDLAIKIYLPTREVFFELARRCVEGGACTDPRDIALLDPLTELPACLKDPKSFATIIADRAALRERFAAVVPPFFISKQSEVPSIEELEAMQVPAAPAAAVGTVLQGSGGSTGVARGRVRIVLDPGDPRGLQDGEVLVAPHTDPAWTPLFLPAAAVIVNVGAVLSHAVIVSRELGIPCAIAVESATQKLVDGMLVEVDGAAGTVRVLED